jgi:L,D-transpeptidase YcbB
MHLPSKFFSTVICFLAFCLFACNEKKVSEEGYEIIKPSEKDEAVQSQISDVLANASDNKFRLDSSVLHYYPVVKNYYNKTENLPIWSSNQQWNAPAISLYNYLRNAALQGLYPADYNFAKIEELKTILDKDSLKKSPQSAWSTVDVLMTDALVGLLKDLKQGRLVADTFSWKNDTSKYNKYFGLHIEKAKHTNDLDSLLETVQPKQEGYVLLKKGIRKFIDSMDNRIYTYVNYPYKDSLAFVKVLKKRLVESGIEIKNLSSSTAPTDTSGKRKLNADSAALSSSLRA